MKDGRDGCVVFVDESGDHGLKPIDPAYPVFILVFCMIRKEYYSRQLLPALTDFKFKHFGHDQVVLHERELRKDTGDFSILRDRARKKAFLDELTDLIAGLDFTIVAAAIHKERLVGRYRYPENPYEIALGFGLERVHRCLGRRGELSAGKTSVIVERRGTREDNELELEFRRICSGSNYDGSTLRFEPRFVAKAANVPGLQVADLVARPIGRYVLDPTQRNRAFEVIERKLDRSPTGEIKGWGLKVFP